MAEPRPPEPESSPPKTPKTLGMPVRKNRWRRALIGLAVVLAALLGVRLWWGWSAERDLQAAIDEIRAPGEPLAWKDLIGPAIGDQDNAVLLYRKAVEIPLLAATGFDEDAGEPGAEGTAGPAGRPTAKLAEMAMDLCAGAAWRKARRAEMEAILSQSAEALGLCRKARACRGADWTAGCDASAVGYLTIRLGRYHRLAGVLCLAGLAAHEAGDDAAAVERVRDALALGRSCQAVPGLIGFVSGNGVGTLAAQAAEQIAPRLAVGAERGRAAPDAVRQLIAEMLDEPGLREALPRALIGDRAIAYDLVERLRRGELRPEDLKGAGLSGQPPTAGFVLAPLLASDEAFLLRLMSDRVGAAREPTYPAMMARMPRPAPPPAFGSSIDRIRRPFSALLLQPIDKTVLLHARHVAMRRMAAAAMAIRLCEVEQGRRPAKLEELVLKHLPAVPVDPFSAEAGPIRYAPSAKPPLLYSLHKDGKDGGGKYAVHALGRVDEGASPDLVFFLDGDRPAPAPSAGPTGEE